MFRPLTPADKALYYHYVDLFYHSDAVEAPVPRKNYDATFAELMRSQAYLKCYIFEDNDQPCGFALLYRRSPPQQRACHGIFYVSKGAKGDRPAAH